MKASEMITLVSVVLGSGIVTAIGNHFLNRRKLRAEGNVAEATQKMQIGLVSVQELEAKLGYLSRVITVLEAHNIRLENDLDQQYQMNERLNGRVRELMYRCDKLEMIVRRLCVENNIDADKLLGI